MHFKLLRIRKNFLTLQSPWGYSSVGRAPALQAGGQEFESLYLHFRPASCRAFLFASLMKKVAIITGASSGMGRVFARTAAQHVEFDELWIIARRADRLEELKAQLHDIQVRPLALDLTEASAISEIAALLAQEKPQVSLLVNGAGFGKFQAVMDVPQGVADSMLDLNCRALMDMCYTCIPYMSRGSKILNIASVAAFQPVPYLAEYAATKAFVLSLSRALWKELRPQGITVTALCPYWTRTEFFDTANEKSGKDRITYYNAMYEAEDVVARGWRDLLKGRDVSTYGFVARLQLLGVKLLPHRFAMWVWCRQQKIKN